MEKLFYIGSVFNGITALYLIVTGVKMTARPHSQLGNIATMLLAGAIFLVIGVISYLFWQNNHPLVSVLITWLPWLVMLFSFAIFMVLTSGVSWH